MSESALWLNYCLAGVISFLLFHFRRLRMVGAVALGTTVSVCLYLVVSFAGGAGWDDPWFGVALFINGFFALVMAIAGAILAGAVRDLRNGS